MDSIIRFIKKTLLWTTVFFLVSNSLIILWMYSNVEGSWTAGLYRWFFGDSAFWSPLFQIIIFFIRGFLGT